VTPENVRRFETLHDLFQHPGWSILEDELIFKTEAIKEGFTQLGVTEPLLAYGQGRISVYRELTSLPAVIRKALDEQDVDENEQADSV
jgi:hypothetical protein